MSLPPTFLPSANAAFASNPLNTLAMNACTTHDPTSILQNRTHSAASHQHHYSVRCSKELKATSQKSSGRCWIFACLNVMRNQMQKSMQLPDDFELSQTYVFYYDKLERCNYFLEQIIDTSSEPLDGRLVQHLLYHPMNDGGQWEMLVNVIDKYGVVPKSVYGDSWSATASVKFNRLMTALLRGWAQELRDAAAEGKSKERLGEMKEAKMVEAHRVLTIHFGKPPESFEWSYHDSGKDKKFHLFQDQTPLSFYKDHVPLAVSEQCSLINDPRNEYFKAYTVDRLGNVAGGKPVLYVNVPIDLLKKYTLETLQDDVPVWMGCDVGKDFNRAKQVMDTGQYDYDLVFGTGPKQTKEQRLRYGQSEMTHAMVFTGADLKEGESVPGRWRVENSWGSDTGDSGYALMTDAWFTEYMYQIVIDKKRLQGDERIRACLEETDPVVLPAWDPMGSLA